MPVIFDQPLAKQWLDPVFGPSDANPRRSLSAVPF
jgi:hypothetical protein